MRPTQIRQAVHTRPRQTPRIAALQDELRGKDEYLQSANEELQTSNEELKSSNEELQSVNEELQSTIEELETSKEELQSVNEELATVNAELQDRIGELVRANNDMNNLLTGTGIGTIFVDLQLNILRFTPTVTDVINLIATDVGRPVGHIVTRLVAYDHFEADVQEVLRSLTPREVEVQTRAGLFYMLRIHPYRTQDNVIEGAVITFFDITELKRTQQALFESNEELKTLTTSLHMTREEERAAVAWELHDEVSQALAIIRNTLTDWTGRIPSDALSAARPTMEETMLLLDSTIDRLRALYGDLVPVMLEDLDLVSAMQWQIEEFSRRTDLKCEIGTMDPIELPDMQRTLALYRVLQEALQHAVSRPGVTHVTIDLIRRGHLAVLRVTDNGRGPNHEDVMKPGTPALVTIRARAHLWGGTVDYKRTEGGNSVLEVSSPLLDQPQLRAEPESRERGHTDDGATPLAT